MTTTTSSSTPILTASVLCCAEPALQRRTVVQATRFWPDGATHGARSAAWIAGPSARRGTKASAPRTSRNVTRKATL